MLLRAVGLTRSPVRLRRPIGLWRPVRLRCSVGLRRPTVWRSVRVGAILSSATLSQRHGLFFPVNAVRVVHGLDRVPLGLLLPFGLLLKRVPAEKVQPDHCKNQLEERRSHLHKEAPSEGHVVHLLNREEALGHLGIPCQWYLPEIRSNEDESHEAKNAN